MSASRKKRRLENLSDSSPDDDLEPNGGTVTKEKRKKSISESDESDWAASPQPKRGEAEKGRSHTEGEKKGLSIAFTSSESSGSDSDSSRSFSSSSSDSDSNSDSDEDKNDDIYENEEDRQRVLGMSERDREAELYRRSEALLRRREQARIKKDLKKRQKAEKDRSKKEDKRDRSKDSSARERERDERERERDRERAREMDDRERDDREKERRKAKEMFQYSDDEEDDDKITSGSEDEKETTTKEEELSVADLNKIRLSRHKLEAWYDQPFFESTVRGCFARMNIGVFDGRAVYRVVEISDVIRTANRVYSVRGKGMCNKILVVKFGKATKQFVIKFASNQGFTETEFQKWKDEMKKYDIPLPPRQQVQERTEAIHKALHYEYTNEDINRMLKEKNDARKNKPQSIVGRNFGNEKRQITMDLDRALINGDMETVAVLQRKMEEVDLASKEYKSQKGTRLDLMTAINKRARNTNKSDRRKDMLAWEKPGEGEMYERRKCRPFMVVNVPKREEDESEKIRKAEELKKRMEKEKQQNDAELRRRRSIDAHDLEKLHDFDIELDIDLTKLPSQQLPVVPPVQIVPMSTNGLSVVMARRALRLADYKQKKGLL